MDNREKVAYSFCSLIVAIILFVIAWYVIYIPFDDNKNQWILTSELHNITFQTFDCYEHNNCSNYEQGNSSIIIPCSIFDGNITMQKIFYQTMIPNTCSIPETCLKYVSVNCSICYKLCFPDGTDPDDCWDNWSYEHCDYNNDELVCDEFDVKKDCVSDTGARPFDCNGYQCNCKTQCANSRQVQLCLINHGKCYTLTDIHGYIYQNNDMMWVTTNTEFYQCGYNDQTCVNNYLALNNKIIGPIYYKQDSPSIHLYTISTTVDASFYVVIAFASLFSALFVMFVLWAFVSFCIFKCRRHSPIANVN